MKTVLAMLLILTSCGFEVSNKKVHSSYEEKRHAQMKADEEMCTLSGGKLKVTVRKTHGCQGTNDYYRWECMTDDNNTHTCDADSASGCDLP